MIAATTAGTWLSSMINQTRRLLVSTMLARSGTAFAVRVTGVAVSFLVSVLFARALGVEQYGIFVFWTTAAGLVGTIASFGAPTVVMRETAAARGADDRSKQARILTFGTCLTCLVTLVLVAVGSAAAILSSDARASLWLTVPFLAFLVPAVGAWTSLQGSLLLGHEKVIASQLLALVAPVVTVGGGGRFYCHGMAAR